MTGKVENKKLEECADPAEAYVSGPWIKWIVVLL